MMPLAGVQKWAQIVAYALGRGQNDQAVQAHLISLGLDPGDFAFQRGMALGRLAHEWAGAMDAGNFAAANEAQQQLKELGYEHLFVTVTGSASLPDPGRPQSEWQSTGRTSQVIYSVETPADEIALAAEREAREAVMDDSVPGGAGGKDYTGATFKSGIGF